MNANVSITGILASPLGADWTIEGLAEQLLRSIALEPTPADGQMQEVVLDADAITDRQSNRLLRPLLACLATKAASENGVPVNTYSGQFCFERSGLTGPVWITGHFENRPGAVRVVFRRSDTCPEDGTVASGPVANGNDSRPLTSPQITPSTSSLF